MEINIFIIIIVLVVVEISSIALLSAIVYCLVMGIYNLLCLLKIIKE